MALLPHFWQQDCSCICQGEHTFFPSLSLSFLLKKYTPNFFTLQDRKKCIIANYMRVPKVWSISHFGFWSFETFLFWFLDILDWVEASLWCLCIMCRAFYNVKQNNLHEFCYSGRQYQPNGTNIVLVRNKDSLPPSLLFGVLLAGLGTKCLSYQNIIFWKGKNTKKKKRKKEETNKLSYGLLCYRNYFFSEW